MAGPEQAKRQSGAGGGQAPPATPAPTVARGMLGQVRAKSAWDMITEAKGKGDRYTTLVRKLPSYLQGSGLGQTFAFLHSKGAGKQDSAEGLHSKGAGKQDSAEGLLLRQLGKYLARYLRLPEVREQMELVLNLDPADYRRATQELMSLAEWMKRFVAESAP